MVILGSQQVGTLKLVTPNKRIERQFNCWLFQSFSYFAETSSYFSMKSNKRKVRKCLRCLKEFSHNLTWRMENTCQFSQGFLQELSKLHILLRLLIYAGFTGKIENKRYCMGSLYKTKSRVTWVCHSVCNAGIPSE